MHTRLLPYERVQVSLSRGTMHLSPNITQYQMQDSFVHAEATVVICPPIIDRGRSVPRKPSDYARPRPRALSGRPPPRPRLPAARRQRLRQVHGAAVGRAGRGVAAPRRRRPHPVRQGHHRPALHEAEPQRGGPPWARPPRPSPRVPAGSRDAPSPSPSRPRGPAPPPPFSSSPTLLLLPCPSAPPASPPPSSVTDVVILPSRSPTPFPAPSDRGM